ncbi:MAG: Mpv17/PMP22 family protein [Paludibacteraceae bacterium]|nr:Mpv17/PMP22 family protein [Paludibacteraceae bacterium]
MKKSDLLFILGCIVVIVPFFVFSPVGEWFISSTKEHPFFMAFVKFAILSTAGEVIGYRIKSGNYPTKEFGVIPRGITWGFLGMLITAAMTIFSKGVPALLMQIGIEPDGAAYADMLGMSILQSASWYHFLVAFMISAFMNCIFAPFFMTLHKISDSCIMSNNGRAIGYFKNLHFGERLVGLDWNMMWNFLFKKTIPFFWIPAHTITFMLAPEFRVLFAALLGVMLGVFMSLATKKK